jgi:hypothetical protein
MIRIDGYRRFLNGGSLKTFTPPDVRLSIPENLSFLKKSEPNELRNIIVGLLDENGFLTQIGVLVAFEPSAIRVYCKPAEGVRTIELGYLRITTDGRELGFVERQII